MESSIDAVAPNGKAHLQFLHIPREPCLFHSCAMLSTAFGLFLPAEYTGLQKNIDLWCPPTPLMPWPVKMSLPWAFRYTNVSRPLGTPWTLRNDYSNWLD